MKEILSHRENTNRDFKKLDEVFSIANNQVVDFAKISYKSKTVRT